MKRYQNSLFAGVAALALIAGTGWASAQTTGGMSSGATQGSQEHGAQAEGGAGQHAKGQSGANLHAQGQSGTNRSAENANSGMQGKNGSGTEAQSKQSKHGSTAQNEMQRNNRQAERHNQNKNSSTAQNEKERNNRQAERNNHERNNKGSMARSQEQREHGHQSTAQRERTLHGLQGNASGQMQGQNNSRQGEQTGQANGTRNGMSNREARGTTRESGTNVQLSSEQRTQIRQTVIDARNAPRVGHVDFDVRVGTVIPRGRIHIVPVPETLVRIEPRWRGFLYFVYSDEVVIVNPHNMRIVAVVPA